MKIFPEVQILLCARLKDIAAGERQRQARKFATTSCHGQPASFASRSYHSVHDSIVVCRLWECVHAGRRGICLVDRGRTTHRPIENVFPRFFVTVNGGKFFFTFPSFLLSFVRAHKRE